MTCTYDKRNKKKRKREIIYIFQYFKPYIELFKMPESIYKSIENPIIF